MEIQTLNTALQMLMPKTSSLQTRTRGDTIVSHNDMLN